MAIIVLLLILGNVIGVFMVVYGLTGSLSRIASILLTIVGLTILVADWHLAIAFFEALKR